MKEISISKDFDKMRLNKYLKKLFPMMPDSLVYKLLRKKYFEINDKKATGSEILNAGDKLSIFLGEDTLKKFSKNADESYTKTIRNDEVMLEKDRIVYEDKNLIVYDKPVGIISQSDKSLVPSINDMAYNYLSKCIDDTSLQIYKPAVVNRLDRNTRGLILIAKTYLAGRELSNMIKNRDIEKHYYTVVNGVIKENNVILTNLYKKDESKNVAIIKDLLLDNKVPDGYSIVSLSYSIIEKDLYTTSLDINLLTGKSHQIRAQLSHIGHPIICDKKYMDVELYNENKKRYGMTSQLLICYKIKFGSFENELLKYLDNKTFVLRGDYGKKI